MNKLSSSSLLFFPPLFLFPRGAWWASAISRCVMRETKKRKTKKKKLGLDLTSFFFLFIPIKLYKCYHDCPLEQQCYSRYTRVMCASSRSHFPSLIREKEEEEIVRIPWRNTKKNLFWKRKLFISWKEITRRIFSSLLFEMRRMPPERLSFHFFFFFFLFLDDEFHFETVRPWICEIDIKYFSHDIPTRWHSPIWFLLSSLLTKSLFGPLLSCADDINFLPGKERRTGEITKISWEANFGHVLKYMCAGQLLLLLLFLCFALKTVHTQRMNGEGKREDT